MGQCFCRRAVPPSSRRSDIRWIVALLPVVLALAFPEAQAAPLEFRYSGVITSADDGTEVSPGDRFNGTFTYDPKTDPQYGMIENARFYEFGTSGKWPEPAPPDTSAMSLTIGGRPIFTRQGGLNLTVHEVGPDERFDPNPRTVVNIRSYSGAEITLANSQRWVLGSLDVPTSIRLTDFPEATISGTWWDPNRQAQLNYRGTIDTLVKIEIVTTPEPASVAMWLGLAGSAWAFRARMRRRG